MHKSYSRSKLVEYIVGALESGRDSADIAKHVAAYLIESGKTSELDSVMRDAQELRAQEYGIIELTARSAHALDSDQLANVEGIAKRQYKTAKKVTVHQVQDETAIGGINLAFPHASLDLTVRAKLNQLREAIV
jgi:F0F1-type ATP synthase delta subunit